MTPIERTIDLHLNHGLNCAQSIVTAFGETLGINPKEAGMLGRPWAGGIGHQGQTCGYLTGALIILAKAFDDPDEKQARKKTDRAIAMLFSRFKEQRGSMLCRDLLGADMATAAGVKRIVEEKLVAKHCQGENGIGKDVAEILAELL